MKTNMLLCVVLVAMATVFACDMGETIGDPKVEVPKITAVPDSDDLKIEGAKVSYLSNLDLLVFEMKVKGKAGNIYPKAKGNLNGAPVLGYVFPTTLSPEDVGFKGGKGIVALAVTSHPDFDDTPLWDEDNDANYKNDGKIYHPHWVILTKDSRVPGGLSVLQFNAGDKKVILPPTNPKMPMFMDSPGFSVVLQRNTLKVLVPAQRVNNKKNFKFDAVAAYMQVMKSPKHPMLGVYKVYSVLSGKLTLPYQVSK